jgi:hypothetical protein
MPRSRHRAHDPNTSSATLDVGHSEFQPDDAAAKPFREHSALVKGGRSLVSTNQPGEFNCPGCAWPDPTDKRVTKFLAT